MREYRRDSRIRVCRSIVKPTTAKWTDLTGAAAMRLENLALSSVGAGRQEQGRLFNQDLSSRQFGSGEAGRQFQGKAAGYGVQRTRGG